MGGLFTLVLLYVFAMLALTSLHRPYIWPFALLVLAVPLIVSHFMEALTSRHGRR